MATQKQKQKQAEKTVEKPLQDIAENAMKNYEQTVRTGLKLQEEANRWWTSTLNQASMAQDWQKRFTTMTEMTNNLMPMAQRRMEEMMEFMQENGRRNADLIKKATDAAQTPTPAESQAKWLEFWTASMGAARSNAESATQLGTRAIDSWISFVRRNTELTEVRVPKGTT
jgi:hypothetical protein